MPRVDARAKELALKIVYCGPVLAGKSTNIRHVAATTSPESRRALTSATTFHQTVSCSFVPTSLGPTADLTVRLYLVAESGSVYHSDSRSKLLASADGIIFVADSQRPRSAANLEVLSEARARLQAANRGADLPLVLQYNKRDLPMAVPIQELRESLNPTGLPDFEGIATQGLGVFDALDKCAAMVIERTHAAEAESSRAAGGDDGFWFGLYRQPPTHWLRWLLGV